MDPLQALSILDQMCQPNKAFNRNDYLLAAQALQVIAEALKPKAEPKAPEIVP
jgi:hypothetical protein